jgi:dimethylglycine dehydrogenase
MKSHYRVVVIGGGIVGTSVLYHLAKRGWTDIALIERAELTAGSTWHAAAGFHSINDDPNIAALQAYTISLYQQIEAESGQSVGLHMPGGYMLASTPERWEWLRGECSVYETLGIHARIATPEEIVAECPIVSPEGLLGGLFDPHEGAVDPHGTTHAFALAAKKRGAEVILRNRVLALTPLPNGHWRVDTEQGTVEAEHVVNAAGLWARRVGRMAGLDLPLTPMQHHYLITESLPELMAMDHEMPCVTDLEGFTYLQQEKKGVLLGVYERDPRHWHTEGAPWDYGMDLIPEEIDRIAPELSIGFQRFPTLERAGIRRWVNGAFTFTPDGNPLVGPVPGLKNYWTACGCMSGFSQGGAIGLVLSNWMVDGDPGSDIFGMDVARYGAYASNTRYLLDTTRQFYERRFVMAYPNEELPAGRPLRTTPAYDAQSAAGARFGVVWGMESPQYYAPNAPDFVDKPTLRRSAAHQFIAGLAPKAISTTCWRAVCQRPGACAWRRCSRTPASCSATYRLRVWRPITTGLWARTTCRSGTCAGSVSTCPRPASPCTTSRMRGWAYPCRDRPRVTYCRVWYPTIYPMPRCRLWQRSVAKWASRMRWWHACRSPANSATRSMSARPPCAVSGTN